MTSTGLSTSWTRNRRRRLPISILTALAGHPGIFHRVAIDQLLASGFISFEFDPDYAHNGKFYTIHLEDPELPASNLPDNKNFPGLNTAGYTVSRTHPHIRNE